MGNLKFYYKALKTGDIFFDEYRKCALIFGAATIMHVLFAVFFWCVDVPIMAIYNIIISFAYQGLAFLVKKKKTYLAAVLGSIEVVIHAVLAVIFVGFASGFQVYCIALVSSACYMTFTMECFKRTKLETVVFSLYFLLGYFACYIISKTMTPLSEIGSTFETIAYVANVFLMFAITFCFMMLLYWDIHHQSDRLLAKNTQLDEMAKKDPLTKLFNRRYMNNELNHRMSILLGQGKIFGLIMADIDDFKKVNDTYGHDAGDDVLVAVANEFTKLLRGDDCVCRWGGEEFLVVINGNLQVTSEVAERIRNHIEKLEIHTGEETIKVTMTFGVCESIPGFSLERLIQIADEHLYKGKQSGKNCVVKE